MGGVKKKNIFSVYLTNSDPVLCPGCDIFLGSKSVNPLKKYLGVGGGVELTIFFNIFFKAKNNTYMNNFKIENVIILTDVVWLFYILLGAI